MGAVVSVVVAVAVGAVVSVAVVLAGTMGVVVSAGDCWVVALVSDPGVVVLPAGAVWVGVTWVALAGWAVATGVGCARWPRAGSRSEGARRVRPLLCATPCTCCVAWLTAC